MLRVVPATALRKMRHGGGTLWRGGVLASGGKRAQGRLVANDQSRALGLKDLPLLEVGKQARHGFAGGADHLCDFFMSQSQFEARLLLLGLAVFRTPLDEQLRKFFGGGMRKTKRADFVAGDVVLLTE